MPQVAATSATLATNKLQYESEHLYALEQMRILAPYYKWTLDLFRPYLGTRVMDAGCGIGSFTALLAKEVPYALAVDLGTQNLKVLKERFSSVPHVEVAQFDLEDDFSPLRSRQIDTIACLDVLEHVRDDVALLRRFCATIRPGGFLLVKVPACPWLFGQIDVASSHYRRYSRAQLADKARQAGWTPVRTAYMNFFGVLPYWWKSRVRKRHSNFSRTFSPAQLRFLRRTVPLLQKLDRRLGPPIGLSAILIAR